MFVHMDSVLDFQAPHQLLQQAHPLLSEVSTSGGGRKKNKNTQQLCFLISLKRSHSFHPEHNRTLYQFKHALKPQQAEPAAVIKHTEFSIILQAGVPAQTHCRRRACQSEAKE